MTISEFLIIFFFVRGVDYILVDFCEWYSLKGVAYNVYI